MTEQSCKTCHWWDIESAKDKAGRVRSDRAAKCLWPTPPLPDAAYRTAESGIHLAHMAAYYGSQCPCWKERE